MRQTTFRTDGRKAADGIIVPLGIVRLIRTSFRRYGFDGLFDRFKVQGIPLSIVLENLCISSLCEEYSMKAWDGFMNRSDLRSEYFCRGHNIRFWTMQRGLERLGDYLEEVMDHTAMLWRTMDPDGPTNAYADGSHIPRHGDKGAGVEYGEGAGTIQLQNQFMTASLVGTGIPVYTELYDGNLNDHQQYSDFIPQLMYFLKRGSLVVVDNGGSAATTLEEILKHGNHYLTRVPLNSSDMRMIEEERDGMVYVGMGVACLVHRFGSGRTKYLFFSVDSKAASVAAAERSVRRLEDKRLKAQKALREDDPDSHISIEDNPFYTVTYENARMVMTSDPWVEIDFEKALKDAVKPRGGWFKLESSIPLDPRVALVVYRHRVDQEHLISFLKSVVNLDPMRVWTDGSTRGRLVLGFVIQFIVMAFINDLEPRSETRTVDGKMVEVLRRPSPGTVVRELTRYQGVVTRYGWGGLGTQEVRDPGVSDEYAALLDRYGSEPPLTIPQDLQWRTDVPVQWNNSEKNFDDLARSISQSFIDDVFPHYFKGRMHWRNDDSSILTYNRSEISIRGGSLGTTGLWTRRRPHPWTVRRPPEKRHSAKWTPPETPNFSQKPKKRGRPKGSRDSRPRKKRKGGEASSGLEGDGAGP